MIILFYPTESTEYINITTRLQFKTVGGGRESQFTKPLLLENRSDSGPVSAVDGREYALGYTAIARRVGCPIVCCERVRSDEQPVFDQRPDTLNEGCPPVTDRRDLCHRQGA